MLYFGKSTYEIFHFLSVLLSLNLSHKCNQLIPCTLFSRLCFTMIYLVCCLTSISKQLVKKPIGDFFICFSSFLCFATRDASKNYHMTLACFLDIFFITCTAVLATCAVRRKVCVLSIYTHYIFCAVTNLDTTSLDTYPDKWIVRCSTNSICRCMLSMACCLSGLITVVF